MFDDPAGDIGVTKTGPDTAAPDTNVTYTITVTTFGPDDVIGAQLTDNLPAGMTFVSLDTSGAPGWSCSDPGAGNNGQVACSISSSSIGDSVFSLTTLIQHQCKVEGDFAISRGQFLRQKIFVDCVVALSQAS